MPSFETMWPKNNMLDWKKNDFFGLIFRLNSLRWSNTNVNPVQHLINRAAKDTDIVKIEQECEVLLITQTHCHKVTKTGTCIGKSERHMSKLLNA